VIIRYIQDWKWSLISSLWDFLLMGIAKILSKISSPYVGFSWKSDSFVSASKQKTLSRDRPWWKCWINTKSGRPWSGQLCMRSWNLVHAWLRDSVIICRKLIIWFRRCMRRDKGKYLVQNSTTWKTRFGNRHRLPLVTGNVPVTDQVLQISQER
jgi:hypothetical protein